MTKNYLPKELKKLVESLSKLPGIGESTASRLALHLMRKPSDLSVEIAKSLIEARKKVRTCTICNNFMFDDECSCFDSSRDTSLLCIVENTVDVMSIENTAQYRGVYHVLGGKISPVEGISPSHLNIESLVLYVIVYMFLTITICACSSGNHPDRLQRNN